MCLRYGTTSQPPLNAVPAVTHFHLRQVVTKGKLFHSHDMHDATFTHMQALFEDVSTLWYDLSATPERSPCCNPLSFETSCYKRQVVPLSWYA
jgi:hypothetical protein